MTALTAPTPHTSATPGGHRPMPDRHIEYVRLDHVTLADRNPKGHDDHGIARSISHFGFAELPLRDERTGRLVAGHGRHQQLEAMHSEGGAPPDGVQVDKEDGMWLMPVIAGWSSRSDDDADAYLIASNQLTTKGGWDEHGLVDILGDLADAQLLELTGYDAGDLDAMTALLRPDADDYGSDQDVLDDTDKAAWPLIRAQVPPDVHQRWQTIDGDDDAQRIRVVMDQAGI